MEALKDAADAQLIVFAGMGTRPFVSWLYDWMERWVRLHYPGAKVLLTSGYPQNAKDTAGLLEPILLKPYRCAALLNRINQVLCNVKA